MANGTVVFQTSVTATPPNALSVMGDSVLDTDHGAGTAQYIKIMDGATGGTLKAAVTANGLVVDTRGSVLGTFQPLAGSVHLANTISGTVQTHGTNQIIGTVQPLAGSVHLASGTVQVLGTTQPLAGSVHLASNLPGGSINAQGVIAHGAGIAGNPLLFAAFGSSGTQAAVDDGDLVRLWADLNGRLQVRGTIDSLPTISGTFQSHGTNQALGTVQPLAGSVHLANAIPAGNNNIGDVDVLGTVQVHGTVPIGTVAGTVSVLGTTQPLAGSVHVANTISGTVQTHGTSQVIGTVQPLAGSVHPASIFFGSVQGWQAHDGAAAGNPLLVGGFGSSGTQAAVGDGDAVRAWFDLNGRLQIRGTIDSMPAVNVSTGTIPGGTIQLHGTSEILGTVRALTTVNVTLGTIAEGTINDFQGTIKGGTIQIHGTAQVLGTVQAVSTMLFGSVQGWQANGGAAAGNPVLMGGFGSSGTQAAVDDGDAVRAWFDLNGRQHVTGTLQPLAGSVHLATNLAGGTVVAVGSAVHGAAADARPLLMAAFGTSGTQAAVDDGDSVRLWADLNGRLQVFGTVGSITPITVGAALPAGDNNIGNVDIVTMPNVTIGAAIPAGNNNIGDVDVASLPSVAGTIHVTGMAAHDAAAGGNPLQMGGVASRARPGTVTDGDAVRAYFDQHGRQVIQVGLGTTEPHGTTFTGAGANGTILAARGAGSFWRVYDILLSGSGAGTFALMMDTTVIWGPLFIAANGGWNFNSAVGVRLPTANSSLNARFTAGTWSLFMNYGLEGV